MLKKVLILFFVATGIFLNGCSKKTVPSKTAIVIPAKSNTSGTKVKMTKPAPLPPKTDTVSVAPAAEEKPAPKPKPDFPQVITVNDNTASKSIDGRLFYDVLGHRYWKNYNDGKYYLFNKSMYSNPDFKPSK